MNDLDCLPQLSRRGLVLGSLVFTLSALATSGLAAAPRPMAENPSPARAERQMVLPSAGGLLYVDTASASVVRADAAQPVVRLGVSSEALEGTPERSGTEDVRHAESGHDAGAMVSGQWLSPDGRYLAVQAYQGPMPVVWIADTTRSRMTRLVAQGYGVFLGWHPQSSAVLYKALDLEVADPGLWLVRVDSGRHVRIEIPQLPAPEGLTAAAVSPDGQTLVYAFTRGLGFGSEVWSVAMGNGLRNRLYSNPHGVVASLAWSPDGASLAFNTLLDSPVPFTESALWVLDPRGGEAEFLATMDGGHGQQPQWSADGSRLYFVARENYDESIANHNPAALVSSIRAIEWPNRGETVVVDAAGARQVDLSVGRNGELVFLSTRGGAPEIWQADAQGRLRQRTTDGAAKRAPVVLGASR